MKVSDYFDKNRYKPKYLLGDRVIGKWNKIPFVGSVANDTVINDETGPVLTVFSDLPIKYKNVWHTIINPKHKDVKKLQELTDASTVKKRVSPSRKKVQN